MKNYFQTSSALSCFIELNQLAYNKIPVVWFSESPTSTSFTFISVITTKKILSANIYVCDDDEDAPWFSFELRRNWPVAPTYNLERIGHFWKTKVKKNTMNY